MRDLAITDTSPLIAFGKIDQLPELYDVVAPERVIAEFGSRPEWLVVEPVRDRARVSDLEGVLDGGEAEAIALALERPGASVLIDEARGRRVALGFGLEVVGTVGVLVRARRTGLIEAVRPLLITLRDVHRFRVSSAPIEVALRQAGES